MTIIKLDKRHFNEMAQIDFESEHELEPNFKLSDYKKILKERITKGDEIFFGLKDKNIIKGYLSLKPFFPGHKHCEVYWLAVRKRFQKQGIGKKLMFFIENYTKKKGFRKVCLYTNKVMKNTRKFYEKIGYKLINEFPNYYGYKKNNTAVLYGKKL